MANREKRTTGALKHEKRGTRPARYYPLKYPYVRITTSTHGLGVRMVDETTNCCWVNIGETWI